MGNNTLAHAIRLKYGTSRDEPNEEQLRGIVADVVRRRRGGIVDEAAWRTIVSRHCPTVGKHKYAAADHSDLNRILDEILRARGLD